jgi:myo-inositol-1-phosphate synthase
LLWTTSTERFTAVEEGVNDTSANLLEISKRGEEEVSASTVFAVASMLEGCTFINGCPQNIYVPGVVDLAHQQKVFIAGDDSKSDQTKMKSVLVEILSSAGIKRVSIVSYNHLGNNDGKN